MQRDTSASLHITLGTWDEQKAHAQPIRIAVFVGEQGVPLELEWDEFDAVSIYAVALDHGRTPVGTGRLLPDGHIGRMAVLQAYRGSGAGSAILRALMQHAKNRGDRDVVLNAQIQAQGFYERHGFAREGEEFMEAGIPHVSMRHVFE